VDVPVKKKSAVLVALVIVCGFVGAGALPAFAVPVVDQTQTVTAAGETSVDCYEPSPGVPVCLEQGSTFTAGMSGRLTSIDVPTFRNVNPADLTVTVWNADAVTGLPTGSAIATQVIPAASLVSGETVSVLFSSPATVVAGTGYVFILGFPLSSASTGPGMLLSLGVSPADKRLASFTSIDPEYGISFTTYVDDSPVSDAPLPDTGSNGSVVGSSVGISVGLLVAGALILVIARRRFSRR
jgi:LPXTG-motif cell wall-anchored protein